MLKGVARKDFDIVASWSVDRLGRSLIDLVNVLQELYSTRVDLYLHQQVINTTTPAGKALFGTMGGPTHILQRSGQPRGATPLSTKS